MRKKTSSAVAAAWVISTFVFLAACSEGNDNNGSFDRTPLLENFADDVIIPAYDQLEDDVNALVGRTADFTTEPSAENLEAIQQAWLKAYISWQYASPFSFGPAGELGVRKTLGEEISLFPVDVAEIERAISSGTYDFNDVNRDARGFLTVEYLLFDVDDDQQRIRNSFSTENRKKFLADLVENIRFRVSTVAAAWHDVYRDQFVSNTGTSVGSGVSMLYNSFLRTYEEMKNFKVALPLGLMVGQTRTEPTKVDAYFSGKSLATLKAQYHALESVWYGKNRDGNDGVGFKEYLDAVSGGPELVAATETQLASIRTALNAIEETQRLSDQIEAGNSALTTLNTELQKNVRYFKGDMASRLGLAITFSSNDGD